MFNRLRNRYRYLRASREAEKYDRHVSAVKLEDGTWSYFTADRNATDAEFRELAFERRHGRPMNDNERLLNQMAGEMQ